MKNCYECRAEKEGRTYNFYKVKVKNDEMVTQRKKTKRDSSTSGKEKVVEVRKRFIQFEENPNIVEYTICNDCIKNHLKRENRLSILFLSLTAFFIVMFAIFTKEKALTSQIFLLFRIVAGFSLAISAIGLFTRFSYLFRDKEGEKRDILFSQILSNSQKEEEENLSSFQLLSSITSSVTGKTALLREFEWKEYQDRLKLSNSDSK